MNCCCLKYVCIEQYIAALDRFESSLDSANIEIEVVSVINFIDFIRARPSALNALAASTRPTCVISTSTYAYFLCLYSFRVLRVRTRGRTEYERSDHAFVTNVDDGYGR